MEIHGQNAGSVLAFSITLIHCVAHMNSEETDTEEKRRNLRKRLQNSNSEFKTITFNKVRSQMVHLISSRGGMYIYTADSTVFCIHPPPRLLTQLKYVLHMFSFSTQGSIAIVSMVFSVFGQIASNSH